MTPYHSRGGATLYHGDCRDVLPGLADTFAAVVTDPPYGQSNEGYDRGVDPLVWSLCLDRVAENAALLSFAGSPTYHRIASDIEAAGWRVRQMWAWIYRDGFITSAWPREGFDRLAPAMDPICYATRGKVLLGLEREGDGEWDRRDCRSSGYSSRSATTRTESARGHWPRSVVASDGIEGFQYFALSRSNGGKTAGAGHPNTKPLALMEWMVSKLPGQCVLDPFCGSGSTLLAAVATGRAAVGIEMNEAYCEIAARRLDEWFDGRLAGLEIA